VSSAVAVETTVVVPVDLIFQEVPTNQNEIESDFILPVIVCRVTEIHVSNAVITALISADHTPGGGQVINSGY
jgi:hypothetical protein